MSKYKLLIFDLDGTLIDSIKDYTTATNLLLEQYGRDPVPIETVTFHIGLGLKRYVFDLFPKETHNQEGMDRISNEFFDLYNQVCLNATYLYPGVADFLKSWQGLSAIVTNKNEVHTLKILRHLLPDMKFSSVYGADSLPERKPHPMPVLKSLEVAGVSPGEALMVGDSRPDILSSRAAGVDVVATSYGYSKMKEIEEHAPNHIIHHFPDLKKIVYAD